MRWSDFKREIKYHEEHRQNFRLYQNTTAGILTTHFQPFNNKSYSNIHVFINRPIINKYLL